MQLRSITRRRAATRERTVGDRLDIVCFCHLHWDRNLFQRPQQIMSRLAERHRVLYVKQVAFKTILRSRTLTRSWRDESGVEVIEVVMPPSALERVRGGAKAVRGLAPSPGSIRDERPWHGAPGSLELSPGLRPYRR